MFVSTECLGLPWSLSVKESACQVEDVDLIPRWRRSRGEGKGNPLQYSCLENPMDRGAWQATVCGVTKTQTWFCTQAHVQICVCVCVCVCVWICSVLLQARIYLFCFVNSLLSSFFFFLFNINALSLRLQAYLGLFFISAIAYTYISNEIDEVYKGSIITRICLEK